jgi:hypothetical protein
MADPESPIQSFLTAFLKVKKTYDDQANAAVKNQYYAALTGKSQAQTDQIKNPSLSPNVAAQVRLAQDRLKESTRQFNENLAFRKSERDARIPPPAITPEDFLRNNPPPGSDIRGRSVIGNAPGTSVFSFTNPTTGTSGVAPQATRGYSLGAPTGLSDPFLTGIVTDNPDEGEGTVDDTDDETTEYYRGGLVQRFDLGGAAFSPTDTDIGKKYVPPPLDTQPIYTVNTDTRDDTGDAPPPIPPPRMGTVDPAPVRTVGTAPATPPPMDFSNNPTTDPYGNPVGRRKMPLQFTPDYGSAGAMPMNYGRTAWGYAHGGLVQKFQDGGLEGMGSPPIADIEEANQRARAAGRYDANGTIMLPADQQPMSQPSSPAPAQPAGNKEDSDLGFNYKATLDRWRGTGENPLTLGLAAIQQHAQEPGASATQPMGAKLVTADGAFTDKEMAAVMKAVDPDNELTEHARYMATLDAGTRFFLNRGDKAGAEYMAGKSILYGKQVSQRIGALAAQAIQRGDRENAAKLLEKAHVYVPDASKLEVQPTRDGYRAKLVDEAEGVTQDLGLIDDQKAYAFAQQMTSGVDFLPRVAGMANKLQSAKPGGRAAQQDGTQGRAARPPSLSDRSTAATDIGTAIEATPLKDEAYKPLLEDVKTIASGLLHANELSPSQAVKITEMMTDVSGPPKYKILVGEGGDNVKVTLPTGETYAMPRNTYLQTMAMRGKAKTLAAELDKKKREADEKGSIYSNTFKATLAAPGTVYEKLKAAGSREMEKYQRARDSRTATVPAATGTRPEDAEARERFRRMLESVGP